jgi:hypothetical protein
MRALRLGVVLLVVVALGMAAAPAAAETVEMEYGTLYCEGGAYEYDFLPGWGSWTLALRDTTSVFVVHYWHPEGRPVPFVSKAGGNRKATQCWTVCPEGKVIDVRGILTPAAGK